MVRFTLHQLLCCAMIALMPASLMAAETGGGMVYVSGSTSVNGIAVTRSSAVFPGDTIATSSSSQAKINAAGASVTVFENSSVKFESGGVSVEDGSVNIGTYTKDLNARAGAVAVTPASSAWTEFEMSHRNGAVQIIARKGDVNISEGSETVTLLQGQSATRDDSATSDNSDKSKKQKKRNAQAPAAGAQKGILDSPVWIGVGAAAIGTGLIYALTRSGSPVSPINP